MTIDEHTIKSEQELEAKMKQIIKDKTPTDVSYVTMYLMPVIREYSQQFVQKGGEQHGKNTA